MLLLFFLKSWLFYYCSYPRPAVALTGISEFNILLLFKCIQGKEVNQSTKCRILHFIKFKYNNSALKSQIIALKSVSVQAHVSFWRQILLSSNTTWHNTRPALLPLRNFEEIFHFTQGQKKVNHLVMNHKLLLQWHALALNHTKLCFYALRCANARDYEVRKIYDFYCFLKYPKK